MCLLGIGPQADTENDFNPLPMMQKYKGRTLDCGYRLDLVIEDAVGVELKYCEKIESLDKSRLQTFLKLSGLNAGLLLNFNVPDLQDGIVRIKNHRPTG